MKSGFILNFAYCRNCRFKVEHGKFDFVAEPQLLKEFVRTDTEAAHDEFTKKGITFNESFYHCPKANLVISYSHCLFEEK